MQAKKRVDFAARYRKDLDFRTAVQRGFRAAAWLVVLCVLALVNALSPIRALTPAYPVPARAEGEARVHFLDVGQGDCTLVEFADGEVLVVDAGDGSFSHNEHVFRYLKGLRPTSLSLLLTHAEADHAGGAEEIVSWFPVEKVYLPLFDSEGEEYLSFLSLLEKKQIPRERISRYGVIANDAGGYAVCLSPRSAEEEAGNDSSAVLYLDLGGVRLLLAADISAGRESLLLREYALSESTFHSGAYKVDLSDVDVLKVSHHGSKDASSQAFLNLLSPQAAILSMGQDNAYGHPAAEALARLGGCGARLYRTDELGDIVLSVKGERFTIYTDYTAERI